MRTYKYDRNPIYLGGKMAVSQVSSMAKSNRGLIDDIDKRLSKRAEEIAPRMERNDIKSQILVETHESVVLKKKAMLLSAFFPGQYYNTEAGRRKKQAALNRLKKDKLIRYGPSMDFMSAIEIHLTPLGEKVAELLCNEKRLKAAIR